ncbi:MAG: GntR family transcriptional regulator [Hyphomicrobium sp.]|uniref:GntR family transcriptional regulator n=1 Tax=Hyphomicrobium sp. TaxID=82 RepID=UPI0039E393C5
MQFAPTKSVSFLNSVAVSGRDARAKLLDAGEVDPPHIVRAALKLKKSENALFVRRLLQLGDRAAAIEAMYLTPSRFPNFLSHELSGSILTLWRDAYHVNVAHSDTTLRGAYLSKEDARLLRVPNGSPTIILAQTMADASGKIFAYDHQTWRFELAEFLISADYKNNRKR